MRNGSSNIGNRIFIRGSSSICNNDSINNNTITVVVKSTMVVVAIVMGVAAEGLEIVVVALVVRYNIIWDSIIIGGACSSNHVSVSSCITIFNYAESKCN